ncbi:hypothetical protein L6164_005754 [Bauhinia variegata]|uniref:Uncharacterized protein n=1 Tax=Bauhinia variegata TaxID=167791 RepID=A0ACB9PTQ5_BAUVA|nr:hypothetical protein L6164_005754 [Bauhinia variegata]
MNLWLYDSCGMIWILVVNVNEYDFLFYWLKALLHSVIIFFQLNVWGYSLVLGHENSATGHQSGLCCFIIWLILSRLNFYLNRNLLLIFWLLVLVIDTSLRIIKCCFCVSGSSAANVPMIST